MLIRRSFALVLLLVLAPGCNCGSNNTGGNGDGDGGGNGNGDGGGGGPDIDADVPPTPTHVNRPPVIYSDPVTAAEEGAEYHYPVLAEDRDGDLLTFAIVSGAPAGMSIDIDTGLIGWSPGPDDGGSETITIRVTDPHGEFDEQTWDLTIATGETPPRITSTPPLVGVAGTTYSYSATAVDPDDTMLTWAV